MYLSAGEIGARVGELGATLAEEYAGREPLFVAPLKASIVFLADLSRATPILHHVDFIELASYNGGDGGSIKLLKDLDAPIEGRDVVLIEDVIDTGLTLNYLRKTFMLRQPKTLNAVTFLDRPYRRLVDDLPVLHVGFTVPDEFFVGYGFDIDERHRNLPDLHIAVTHGPDS